MKKLVKTVFLFFLVTVFIAYPVQAANDSYSLYVGLNPGDHLIIYSDNTLGSQITYYGNYEEELSKYSGHLFPAPVQKIAINEANVRTGPGMSFDIVDRLIVNDIVNVYGEFYGTDNDWTWYLLENGCYTSAHLFSDVNGTVDPIRPNRVQTEIYMFASPVYKQAIQEAYVHTEPDTNSPITYTLSPNTSVTALGTIDTVSSEYTWLILDNGYVVARLFN